MTMMIITIWYDKEDDGGNDGDNEEEKDDGDYDDDDDNNNNNDDNDDDDDDDDDDDLEVFSIFKLHAIYLLFNTSLDLKDTKYISKLADWALPNSTHCSLCSEMNDPRLGLRNCLSLKNSLNSNWKEIL